LEFNSFIGASYIQDLSVCDEIIDYFDTHPERFSSGKLGGNKVDESCKKSTDMDFDTISASLTQRYYDNLGGVLREYCEQYEHCDKNVGPWGMVESPNIQKYNPGDGFYVWHSERSTARRPVSERHLVFMTYLNDVTDAGETEFFYQQVKVCPKKGLTLIWPADWTHTHRGITSPTQTKYIITGWYSFVRPH
jgi:hypothetical protein